MKKETLILLGVAAAAGFYFYTQSKKRSGLVTVESPEKITETQFDRKETSLDSTSPLEKITKVVQTIFPKKTAEQKAAKKLKRQTRQAARKKVAGFSDNVLY